MTLELTEEEVRILINAIQGYPLNDAQMDLLKKLETIA